MINRYKIDYELSRTYYNKYEQLVKPKLCYNNTFNIATRLYQDFSNWRVAFGAWSFPGSDTTFTLHCFLIYDGKIVDPTAFSRNSGDTNPEEVDYLIFKTFEINEYIDLATKCNDCSLMSILKEDFDELCQDLFFNEGIGLNY